MGQDTAHAHPYVRNHRGIPPKSKGDYVFISHMIDTFEEEKGIDLDAVKTEITNLEAELTTVRTKMVDHLKKLGL